MDIAYNKNKSATEIPGIGLLRGIAAAMVCYFHVSRGNDRFLPNTSIVKQLGSWGWSGVEIFFIISGFIIPYSMYIKKYSGSDFFIFLKKRLIRIEPPYLISILLVILMAYVSTLSPYYRGVPFHVDWLNVASHIAYLNVFTKEKWLIDVYWTLAIEFQYYILIALVYKLVVSDNLIYRVLFYIPFMALFYLHFLGNSFIFNYAVYFLFGILLFQVYCNIISQKEFFLVLIIPSCLLILDQGIILLAISLITMFVMMFVKKVPAFLKYLGSISYSLYLIHIPIGGRIINISEVLIKNEHARELMVFLAFLISIFAAHFFYIFIEQKFKKISSRINYSKG